ncbi:MAG TPA: 3-oxoacyl-ACP synthase, partial [bacterium]|nr:3-oxoacyl-ACP synthase [bacterium]
MKKSSRQLVEWRKTVDKKAGIIGTGHYVPEKVLTNFDLEKMVDTSDEWIRTRSGIEERRIAAPDEFTSDLGVKAAEQAVENAGIKKEDIDLIITSTISPDYAWPATACRIGAKMGMKGTPAYDMSAACSGFVYALANAKAFVESGIYKKIL